MPRAKKQSALTPPTPTTPPTPFVFACNLAVFPAEEIAALEQHGARLEQLASGLALPSSPEEEHFLRVDRQEAEPVTVVERAWLRLKERREYEREQKQRQATPPPPPEDYGMIEFDADRCWW